MMPVIERFLEETGTKIPFATTANGLHPGNQITVLGGNMQGGWDVLSEIALNESRVNLPRR